MKTKLRQTIKNEFNDWKLFEILLVAITSVTIISVPFILLELSEIPKIPIFAILAGLSGIVAAVFGSKGKISGYIFMIFSQILMVVIGFTQKNGILFSTIILALAFYIPINIFGFIKWLDKRDKQSNVLPRRISFVGIVSIIIFFAIVYVSYSLIIKDVVNLKINRLWFDGAVLWMTIFATILYIFRFIEQWVIWFIKNITIILMWTFILIGGKNNARAIIFITTYIGFLINAVYGFFNWHRLHKKSRIYQLPIFLPIKYAKLSLLKKINYNFGKMFFFNPKSKFLTWKANTYKKSPLNFKKMIDN